MIAEPIPRALLTVEETARHLSIGRTMVYELIRAGDLDKVRIGRGGTRITVPSIEAYIERARTRPRRVDK